MTIRLILLATIFMTCSLQACEKAAEKATEPFSGNVITLIGNDEGDKYEVSREIAITSETIKNLIEDLGWEAPIPLDWSSKLISELATLSWSLFYHKDSKGKALSDALLQEVKISDPYQFLRFANYLGSDPILDFAYLCVIKNLLEGRNQQQKKYNELKEQLSREFSKFNVDRFLKQVSRYFILIASPEARSAMCPLDMASLWGLSIKDCLDCTPEIFEERIERGRERVILNLRGLQLNNLEGLETIKSVLTNKSSYFGSVYSVCINNNAFDTISAEILRPLLIFKDLKEIDFSRNYVKRIKANTFIDFEGRQLTKFILTQNPKPGDYPSYYSGPRAVLEIEDRAFSGLSIDELELTSNNLRHISSAAFIGLRVKDIYIGEYIESIEPGAFNGLVGNTPYNPLRKLHLYFGYDAAPLNAGAFAGLSVKRMMISGYPHTDIDPEVFLAMPYIEEIGFKYSALSESSMKKLKKALELRAVKVI